MSKPVCTCTHEVTPQHGHDRTCAKGLYAWNSFHKRKVRRLDAENESLRQKNRELRARVRESEADNERLRAALGQIAGCDTPGCDACRSEYPEAIARDALDSTTSE